MSKGDKKRLSAINDLTHVDFFHVTVWGTQRLAFLSLGKIFDQSRGALKLRDLVRKLNDTQLSNDVDTLYDEHEAVIEQIRRIRNESVAHNDRNTDERSLFEEVGITPNEMEHLIEDVCRILNGAGRKESFPIPIPDDLRFKNAVHGLLDKLGNG